MDYVEGTRKLFQCLGFFVIGLGGTYWYMKDKAIITSGPGATFNLYFKYFIVFALLGGLLGGLIGILIGHVLGLVVAYWYVLVIIIGVGVLAIKKTKTDDSEIKKQSKYGVDNNQIFCGNCGSRLARDSKYCGKCGTKVQ